MNKKTEALKMAKQHIIERKGGRGGAVCYVKSDEEVIKAIDEALAQPAQEYLTRAQQVIRANNSAQEPVAWVGSLNEFDMRRLLNEGYELSTALYTHPCVLTHSAPSCTTTKEWVGLSDDDMSIIFDKFDWKEVEIAGEHLDLFAFARAIEQELKRKNGFNDLKD